MNVYMHMSYNLNMCVNDDVENIMNRTDLYCHIFIISLNVCAICVAVIENAICISIMCCAFLYLWFHWRAYSNVHLYDLINYYGIGHVNIINNYEWLLRDISIDTGTLNAFTVIKSIGPLFISYNIINYHQLIRNVLKNVIT